MVTWCGVFLFHSFLRATRVCVDPRSLNMMFMIPCHCCGSPLVPLTAYSRGNSSWTMRGSTDAAPSVLFPGGEEGGFSPHQHRSTFIHDPALLEQAALVYSCGYSTAESHLYHSTRSGVVARDLSSLLAAQLLVDVCSNVLPPAVSRWSRSVVLH